MYALGIDIGGTKVAIGIVSAEGKVIAQQTIPSNLEALPLVMIDEIYLSAMNVIQEAGLSIADLKGVGVGAPGPLDAKNGVITCPSNLPNWGNVPLVQELEQRFHLPVRLDNDANAATLGEKWVGAAKDNDQFVYITISTGIGAGLFANGKLLSGATGNAGEIGHLVIDPSKGTCPCGQKGCLEWVASGTAIARQATERMGQPMTSKEAFDLYHEGHPVMKPFVEEVFMNIGIGIVSVINFIDPEKIVIGGGVSEVGEPLFATIRDYVAKYALNPSGRNTPIVPAGLRTDAGLIGAAALILAVP